MILSTALALATGILGRQIMFLSLKFDDYDDNDTGVFLPTMERRVPGAVPKILNETLNVDFTKQYSLYTLALTTGAKGLCLI